MVLITLVRDYIDRMLHDIPGMKVLVLDPQTVGMVSVVYNQSDLLRKEVFLVETMDNVSSSRESMAHLKAVYFLQPSADNVQKLRRHLAMPCFAEYHLSRCREAVTHCSVGSSPSDRFCSLGREGRSALRVGGGHLRPEWHCHGGSESELEPRSVPVERQVLLYGTADLYLRM